jgi:hypothetical protein
MVEKTTPPHRVSHLFLSIARWFDSYAGSEEIGIYPSPGVDWLRIIPFIVLHGMCFGVIWVGWSWTAVIVAAANRRQARLEFRDGYAKTLRLILHA